MAGVLIPTCENMWGVLIFLRFFIIVGNAGVYLSVLAVFFSFTAAIFTAASLGAFTSAGAASGSGSASTSASASPTSSWGAVRISLSLRARGRETAAGSASADPPPSFTLELRAPPALA